MGKINKWIRKNWTDPVLSKVFAGAILAMLGVIVTWVISLFKQIPFLDIYNKSTINYIRISYFNLFIIIVVILSFLIPLFALDILKFKVRNRKKEPISDEGFLNDKNTFESMFPGKWLNKYEFKNGSKGDEILEIKNGNEYHALGRHIFNIDQFSLDKTNKILTFRKKGVGSDVRKAVNILSIVNEKYYEGTETDGTRISYTRIDQ